MNMWLTAAPDSQVAHGALGCDISLNDLCDRPPRALAEGEVIDLGGKRLRQISTPHVPHGWEAQVLFEETTGTLLCGDLFSQVGSGPALTTDDVVGPALAAESMFHATVPGAAHRPDAAGAGRPRADDAGHHARAVVPGRRQAGPVRPGRGVRGAGTPELSQLGSTRSGQSIAPSAVRSSDRNEIRGSPLAFGGVICHSVNVLDNDCSPAGGGRAGSGWLGWLERCVGVDGRVGRDGAGDDRRRRRARRRLDRHRVARRQRSLRRRHRDRRPGPGWSSTSSGTSRASIARSLRQPAHERDRHPRRRHRAVQRRSS